MAVFNPVPPETQAPDMTRNSGGPIVRRGLQTLFEGAAEVGQNVVNALDFRNQSRLREDIRTGVEIVRDQYGVNAGSDTAQGSLFQYDQSPEGLNQAYSQIDSLEQAYQNGTLRESYYYAQLNSLVRSVKSRYPGYEAEIDNEIRSITGVDPANAYISQLRQEALADATSGSESTSRILADAERDRGVIVAIDPDFFGRPLDEQLRLYNYGSDLRLAVSRSAGLGANLAYNQNLVANGALDASQGLYNSLSDVYDTFMASVADMTPEGGEHVDPLDVVQYVIQQGAQIEPDDIQGAIQFLQGITLELETSLRNVANQEEFRGVDRSEINEIIDGYTSTLNYYIDAIMNERTGPAAMAEAMLGLNDTQVQLALRETFGDSITVMETLTQILPEAFMERIADRQLAPIVDIGTMMVQAALSGVNMRNVTEMQEFLHSMGVPMVTAPDGTQVLSLNNAPALLTRMGLDEDQRDQAMQALINDNLMIIQGQLDGNTEYDPNGVSTAIQTLFTIDGGFDLNQVPPDEQARAYAMLTNPAVAGAVNSQHPELWNDYMTWAVEEFKVINSQLVDDINAKQEAIVDAGTNTRASEAFLLTFHQNSGYFELTFNPEYLEARQNYANQDNPAGFGGAAYANPPASAQANMREMQSLVNELNISLRPMSNLMRLDGGQLDEQGIAALLPTELDMPIVFDNTNALGQATGPADLGRTPNPNEPAPPLTTQPVETTPPVDRTRPAPTPDAAPANAQDPERMRQDAERFLGKFNNPNNDKLGEVEPAQVEISHFISMPENNIAPSGLSAEEVAQQTTNPATFAAAFLGASETGANSTLRAFFQRTTGSDLNPAEIAWCARFVRAILNASGFSSEGGTDWARSFLNVGDPVSVPRQGDIVVMERGGDPSTGHVGFFVGFDSNGNVRVLGGNQGDEVSIDTYSRDRVIGYRRPELGN